MWLQPFWPWSVDLRACVETPLPGWPAAQATQAVQARRTGRTSSGGKLQQGSYNKQALAAALSWQHTSLTDKNAEGSATSDEDHPRYHRSLEACVCLMECLQVPWLQGLQVLHAQRESPQ